jgi:hypothetical protein
MGRSPVTSPSVACWWRLNVEGGRERERERRQWRGVREGVEEA